MNPIEPQRAPEFVRKIRTGVELVLASGPTLTGWLALSPMAPLHAGPETLLEKLNGVERVLPVEGASDSGVLLVNPSDLEYLKPDAETTDDLVRPGRWGEAREERVRVRLQSGHEIEGILELELPEGFNRVSDFLNGIEDFFLLDTEDGPVLINKRRVSLVRLFEGSPPPAVPPTLRLVDGG